MSKIGALLLAACLLLSGTGCQALDVFSVDSLLRAPKLTGENARIQKSFESTVGKDVQLVNPLMGKYRSAFVFIDYDADGENETLVFYSKNDAPGELHVNFMDYIAGEWVSVGDVTGSGSEVYSVEFANTDDDDCREILVAWTKSDTKRSKTLSVIKYFPKKNADGSAGNAGAAQGTFEQLSAVQIIEYLALDFDFDGAQEILYLSSDPSAQTSVIKACVMKENAAGDSFEPLSEVELSRSVEMPVQSTYDVCNGYMRVYFDCIDYDDSYMTEILIYDHEQNTLIRPQDESGEALATLTHRNEDIRCVKGENEMVSLPIRYAYANSYILDNENDVKSEVFVTEFVRLNSGVFESDSGKYFYDFADGCRILLDDVFDEYSMIYDTEEHQLRFYDNRFSEQEQVMFSIRFETQAEESAQADEGTEVPNYDIYISNRARGHRVTEEMLAAMIEPIKAA